MPGPPCADRRSAPARRAGWRPLRGRGRPRPGRPAAPGGAGRRARPSRACPARAPPAPPRAPPPPCAARAVRASEPTRAARTRQARAALRAAAACARSCSLRRPNRASPGGVSGAHRHAGTSPPSAGPPGAGTCTCHQASNAAPRGCRARNTARKASSGARGRSSSATLRAAAACACAPRRRASGARPVSSPLASSNRCCKSEEARRHEAGRPSRQPGWRRQRCKAGPQARPGGRGGGRACASALPDMCAAMLSQPDASTNTTAYAPRKSLRGGGGGSPPSARRAMNTPR